MCEQRRAHDWNGKSSFSAFRRRIRISNSIQWSKVMPRGARSRDRDPGRGRETSAVWVHRSVFRWRVARAGDSLLINLHYLVAEANSA